MKAEKNNTREIYIIHAFTLAHRIIGVQYTRMHKHILRNTFTTPSIDLSLSFSVSPKYSYTNQSQVYLQI